MADKPPLTEKTYVIPISCWKPHHDTGVPADAKMHPPGCPDADWCRGNRTCFWGCRHDGHDDIED